MSRFIPNENAYVGFTPAITGTVNAPKVADVSGSVDLTDGCMTLQAGAQGQAVPTPTLSTLFETSIPGTSQANFTADFYRDDVSANDTPWTTLPRGTKGFFIIARFGGKPAGVGKKCEIWPVQVLSRSHGNMASGTATTFTVTCSVPQVPGEDAVVVT